MTRHTPGPWVWIERTEPADAEDTAGPGVWIRGEGTVVDTGAIEAWPLSPADAARIVACVNACDGIEDPAAALAEVLRILAAIALYADGAPAMESRRALSLLEPK